MPRANRREYGYESRHITGALRLLRFISFPRSGSEILGLGGIRLRSPGSSPLSLPQGRHGPSGPTTPTSAPITFTGPSHVSFSSPKTRAIRNGSGVRLTLDLL